MTLDGKPGFQFVFGGCAWIYLLSGDYQAKEPEIFLSESGVIRMLREQVMDYPPIRDITHARLRRKKLEAG